MPRVVTLLGAALVILALVLGFMFTECGVEPPHHGGAPSAGVVEVANATTVPLDLESVRQEHIAVGRAIRVLSRSRGLPIAGAAIRLGCNDSRFVTGDCGRWLGETSADGVFWLGPDSNGIWGGHLPTVGVDAPGYVRRQVAIDGASRETLVYLEDGRGLKLRFVDDARRPVPGVYVLLSPRPFDPGARALVGRPVGKRIEGRPDWIHGGMTGGDGGLVVEAASGGRFHAYCYHREHVAVEAAWSLGGEVDIPAHGCEVAMSQVKFALALLPRGKYMACRYTKPSGSANAAIGALGMRSRALAKDLSNDAWCAVAAGHTGANLSGAEHADLSVTLLDGAERLFRVPLLSMEQIEGGGRTVIELPDVAAAEVARLELEVTSASGDAIVGVPFSARKTPQPRGRGTTGRIPSTGLAGESVHGRSGSGSLAVLPGLYEVALDKSVGAQAKTVVGECVPGQVTKLRVAIPRIVGCSVTVTGENAGYLGDIAYGVMDVHGRRVAGYVGPSGLDAQVWLSEGSYTCNVNLGFMGKRSVPLVVVGGAGEGVVVAVDVGR
jgi:hypothetical protein